jgi:hypothetical protein
VTSSTADRQLAEAGRALADAVVAAVPGWMVRAVLSVADAWQAAGHTLATPAVAQQAADAARQVADQVAARLYPLVEADVDDQRTTPLAVVRASLGPATAVLRRAGVAPVERDDVAARMFPDDDYGLVPASLAAVAPDLGDLGVAWGAAKAMAHRARHRHGG